MNLREKLRRKDSENMEIVLEEKMLEELRYIRRDLRRNVSLRYSFVRGMIAGVGTFIGATIVAGIVIGLLSQIVDSSKRVEILKDFYDQWRIEETLDGATRN